MSEQHVLSVMKKAEEAGVSFFIEGENLRIRKAKHTAIDDTLMDLIRRYRDGIREQLAGQQEAAAAPNYIIAPGISDGVEQVPLSFAQERLWFIDRLQGSVQYHIPWVYRVKGTLDVERLNQAFRSVISRHAVLRTVIREEDDKRYQLVQENTGWALEYYADEMTAGQLYTFIESFIARPFDLSADSMLRAALVRTGEQEYILAGVVHHIAFDGWSAAILAKELSALYNGDAVILPELKVQYRDYAFWQRTTINDTAVQQQLDYWKKQLDGVLPCGLSTDFTRPAEQSHRGAVTGRNLGKPLSQALIQLSKQEGVTLFMTLLAAYQVLLYRYSGQADTCVGTPVAGRRQHEVEALVGFFINTLPLRNTVNRASSFVDFLHEVKQTTLQAYEHQDIPFERIVETAGVRRDMSRSPIFQVLFSMQQQPDVRSVQLGEAELIPELPAIVTAQYDLALEAIVTGDDITLSLTYSAALYQPATITQMLTHYVNLLEAIIAAPQTTIGKLNIISETERYQLLQEFNATGMDYPSGQTVVQLLEQQAKNNPDRTALIFDTTKLSYKELDGQSNQLAHYLLQAGIGKETVVPVCMHRGTDMVVAILAILKAGAAFIPLDPAFPRDRIQYMLHDSGSQWIITNNDCTNLFGNSTVLQILNIDTQQHAIKLMPTRAVEAQPSPADTAYVIYTSGSTGKPKGVMIGHRSLVNFISSMQQLLHIDASCRMYSVTTFSFDIFYLELFLPLLSGGEVVIAGKDTARDGYRLREALAYYQPTHMQAVPALWQLLLECDWRNDENLTVLVGGEAVREQLKDSLAILSRQKIWNLYGPTETTIWSTAGELQAGGAVTIGKPIGNTAIYILDEDRQLQPIGVAGELYIGGDGLAKGYLGRADLTEERFVMYAVNDDHGAGKRIYRTGDLARWLPDGRLVYAGRADEQLKVRGYRIEPGEIETVLLQAPGVSQAVVVAQEDAQQGKRLVAFIVESEGYNRTAVIQHAGNHLPDYMVPRLLVSVPRIPQTPNGKADRKALLQEAITLTTGETYTPAGNTTEETLVAIWQDVLGVPRVGINDNFFELGGHSLLAMSIIAAVRKKMGIELPVRKIFLFPTVARLALQVNGEAGVQVLPPVEPRAGGVHIPLSFAQERLWFIDRLQGSTQYHMPRVIRIHGALNRDLVEHAFKVMLQRHEVLRTVIREEEGIGRQVILDAHDWTINYMGHVQWQALADNEKEIQIESFLETPFDLGKDVMIRVLLIETAPGDHILAVVAHHIAFDGWSISIMQKEWMDIYRNRIKDSDNLPALPIQYADYAVWQRTYLSNELLEQKLAYWKSRLQGITPLALPVDYPRTSQSRTLAGQLNTTIPAGLTTAVKDMAKAEGATLFMSMVSVLNLLLHRYTLQDDICIGSPVANRNQPELEALVGFFVNSLVLRNTVSSNMNFRSLLQQVKHTTTEAYAHQDMPFEKIVEAIVKDRDMNRNPIFQVMLVVQQAAAAHLPPDSLGSGLHLEDDGKNYSGTKFDLVFTLTERENDFDFGITYDADLFMPATITRMSRHFINLLQAAVLQPALPVGALPMMDREEEELLLKTYNDTAFSFPADTTVIDWFEQQVNQTPTATAVAFEHSHYSYAELNTRANQLAAYLQKRGIEKDIAVPICLERSLDMIVGILGILKAGGAYVPIDPQYPGERIRFMLTDTGAGVVLSTSNIILPEMDTVQVIRLDTDWDNIAQQEGNNPERAAGPDNLAYIIYTSGSTGRPKGVMIEHSGLFNRLAWAQHQYGFTTEDTILQKTTFCFDVSVWELIWPLLTGAKLVFAKPEGHKDSHYLHGLCTKERISVMHFVPSMLDIFLADTQKGDCPALKKVLCSGEALTPMQVKLCKEKLPHVELHNLYGPTEAAIDVTFWPCPGDVSTLTVVPIGKPVANTKLYIVDQGLRLMHAGGIGELCIAGIQVARGYLNLEQLTKEKFVADPFSTVPGSRMYRTGDLARWLPDGNIEYLGRKDDQVKIRGYRIELGEVESCLAAADSVAAVKLLAVKEAQGDNKKLLAYVQVDKTELPLLASYLHLYRTGAVTPADLQLMPNGLPLLHANQNEVQFLYKEIFAEQCYLKHGITLRPGSCVIDVGANIGSFTVFLNVMHPGINVYSFEPVPAVFDYLDKNRKLYGVKGKAFSLALLDREQDISFTYYPQMSIVSGIGNNQEKVKEVVRAYIESTSDQQLEQADMDALLAARLHYQEVTCHAKTLSQVIAEEGIQQIDLLKIDVENAEHLVLAGISDADWSRINNLVVEVHDAGNRVALTRDMLITKGFTVYTEKEEVLSGNHWLYNLYAVRDTRQQGLPVQDMQHPARAAEWRTPADFILQLRQHTEKHLPPYMVPAQFILMAEFPVTPNGKIDKAALPAEGAENASTIYAPPRNAVEAKLAGLWQTLLHIEQVGIHDNFFAKGGHSLLAMRLVAAIRREYHIELPVKIIFDNPVLAALAEKLGQYAPSVLPPITVRTAQERVPLSFYQERLWFTDKLQGSQPYQLPWLFNLKGALSVTALENAFRQIVERHEVLRTAIHEEEGIGYQVIRPAGGWQMQQINAVEILLMGFPAPEAYLSALLEEPFDLSAGNMLRVTLVKMPGDEYLLFVVLHHIAFDAWSVSIMVEELVSLYRSYTTGSEAVLKELPVQYADYACWQRNYLDSGVLDNHIAYWRQQLEGVEPLALLTDHPRSAGQHFAGAMVSTAISKTMQDKITALGQQEGTTLFMTLLTVFKVLLYRYTGQEDICVGTSIAARPQREVEDLIGFFVNTLALRSQVDGNQTFRELLQQVKQTTLDAYAHQDVPFEKVVEALGVERELNRNPLFQVILVLENVPVPGVLDLGNASLTHQPFGGIISKFDITLGVAETATGLELNMTYRKDLFREDTMEAMLQHYVRLLDAAVNQTDSRIGYFSLPDKAEEAALLSLNAITVDYPVNKTVTELFTEQALRVPDAVALVYGEEKLTYRQLEENTNQLAHYLRRRGVEADQPVPICLERGIAMMTGILAIMKAGGAYVPIDPDFPDSRIRFVLEETAPKVVITGQDEYERIHNIVDDGPLKTGTLVMDMDADSLLVSLEPSTVPDAGIHPGNLAYMIYTSGSTGQPKGVMIEHRHLVDYVYGLESKTGIWACQSFALVSTLAADLGNTVLYSAWLSGGTLHVCSRSTINDGSLMLDYFRQHRIACLKIVPSHWKALCIGEELLLPEKLLIFGGEALQQQVVERIDASGNGCEVINHYGPTETTIGKLLHQYNPAQSYNHNIPIGRPFSNTTVYVLSQYNTICPIGVPGEICVSGSGVARGYFNQPALTAEKFTADPFNTGARLYRTGDRGRLLPGGAIEYLGRVDDQVKIRGYRIELGEVEQALRSLPAVAEAVVLAKEDDKGDKRLAAYVVANGLFDREEIIAALRERLPEYMIPALVIPVEAIPLTANGKVNRKRLLEIDPGTAVSLHYTSPRNETEIAFTALWQELLDTERIGIYDNFFELGGDSIIAIQLVSRARRSGYELQVGDIFEYQTIAGLAAYWLTRSEQAALSSIREAVTGPCSLLPVQRWYLGQSAARVSHFNQALLLGINKTVDQQRLQKAIDALVQHHDALRMVYHYGAGGWQQEYGDGSIAVQVTAMQHLSMADLTPALEKHNDEVQSQLDIEKGILCRVVLVQTPAAELQNRLLLVIHHLVIDGVSWRILLEDLIQLLNSPNSALPAKTASLRDWHEALVQYGQQPKVQAELEYWKEAIAHYRPLPVDLEYTGPLLFGDMHQHNISLDAAHTKQLLQELPGIYHTQINDVLLTALGITLTAFGKTDQIVIGLEGHGREPLIGETDVSRTIGWFTNTCPMVLRTTQGAYTEELKNIKEQLRRVPGKGMSYMIQKFLEEKVDLQDPNPWDVVFNYLGQLDNAVINDEYLSVATESAGNNISPLNPGQNKLVINSMVQDGVLTINWLYSRRHYAAGTMETLAAQYIQTLATLIDNCLAQRREVFTPSDYGIGDAVGYKELDAFLGELVNEQPRLQQVESLCRLSAAQQGMLFHSLYEDGSGLYAEQFSCRFTGLDPDRFRQSWNHLVQYHSILRTAFYHDVFNIPVQCVYKKIQLPLTIHDLRGQSAEQQQEAVRAHAAADRLRGFNLHEAPLFRVTLLQLGKDVYDMIWTYHHIIMDGWSLPVLMEEFMNSYESMAAGRLPKVLAEDRYEEFIRFVERRNLRREEAYWRRYLQGVEEPSLLPFCPPGTPRNKGLGRYQAEAAYFDAAITASLQAYAQQHRITVNTVVQGIWAYLLSQYTGNPHVVYGVTVAGRPDDLARVEHRVGMYINTIPLHATVQEDMPWANWLQGIQQDQLAARNYQYVAMNDIQRWINIPGDLFDTVLVYENYPVSRVLTANQWQLRVDDIRQEGKTNYLLYLIVQAADTITVEFHYNADILPAAFAAAVKAHFDTLLRQLITEQDILLRSSCLIPAVAPASATADYPVQTVTECFALQAAQTPDAIAITFGEERWSYEKLDKHSTRLAHYLRNRGVTAGMPVAVCIDRSASLIITLLAVLKAGAVYVPVDPAYPAGRMAFMLKDTGSAFLLTENDSTPAEGVQVINISIPGSELDSLPTSIVTGTEPSSLAYIMYTSGSTGTPKGVMVTHSNIVSLVKSVSYVQWQTHDALLATGSPSFDATTFEYWGMLLNGGRLVIGNQETLLDTSLLQALIRKEKINKMWFTAGWFNQLVETAPALFATLETVLVGGDRLSPHHIRQLQHRYPLLEIINGYGPTENTTFSLTCLVPPVDGRSDIPIGQAIDHRSAYVLDQYGNICPVGVKGELCVGGAGLSMGYWKQQSLTSERFIHHPRLGRLYHTGDMAMYHPEGTILFLGRNDVQVKIRGYRVEPGEIENVLLEYTCITQAAVVVTGDVHGSHRLVGYVVPNAGYNRAAAQHYIQGKLPAYMLPQSLVELSHLPLTANGKVDRKALTGLIEKEEAYWKEQLHGVHPVDLPTDVVRPAQQTHGAEILYHTLEPSLAGQLQQLAGQQGVSLFTVLLTAYKVLLFRYSGQADNCVACPAAACAPGNAAHTRESFAHLLPLRNTIERETRFTSLLLKVSNTAVEAYAHRNLPFDRMAEAAEIIKDQGRNPLYQVACSFAQAETSVLNKELPAAAVTSVYELSLEILSAPDGIRLSLISNKLLFRSATANRIMEHFVNLLNAVVAAPGTAIGALTLMSDAERHLLTETFNSTAMAYPAEKTMIHLFREQAAINPGKPALTFDNVCMSYLQLEEESNRLAHYFIHKGISAGMLVPVCMQRNATMVAALLAVLKTGAGFVPIDPSFPAERIRYMLEDCSSECVITDNSCVEIFTNERLLQVLNLEDCTALTASMPPHAPGITPAPDGIAYVIYTSGSTGKPKGVAIKHHSLVNLIWSMKHLLGIDASCRMYSVTTFCFDIFYNELFLPLSAGGEVILGNKETVQDGHQLVEVLRQHRPTHLQAVPAMWQMLLDSGWTNPEQLTVMTGGEVLPEHIKDTLCTLSAQPVWNLYGPTETTIWSTAGELKAGEPVSIGRPIGNTQVYIMDEERQLQPLGVAGELYIGGGGLAWGYLNRPGLTEERFITHTYKDGSTKRLYRTGDLARWQPDGRLCYCGRADQQVKIHGYRIEPGEIESVLQQAKGVRQAVVVTHEDSTTGKRLVGFIVVGADYDKAAVLQHLSNYLPGYMVPRILVTLPHIPRTPNGKADRKALQQMQVLTPSAEGYEGAQTETEATLIQIWQDTLGVKKVGIHDNFFELGGDSIISIQIVSRLRRAGYHLVLKDLFEHPTISRLVASWASRAPVNSRDTSGEKLTRPSGLLPIQRWFLEQSPAAPSHFNQAVLLGIDKGISADHLQQALARLAEHHDALRFVYHKDDDEWQQTYGGQGITLEIADLSATDDADIEKKLATHNDTVQRSLDITRGHLFKPVLIRMPASDNRNRLLLVIHHLVTDGVSWRILLEDLEYLLEDVQAVLPAKTASVRDWYDALVHYGQREDIRNEEAYWQQRLSQYSGLPVDHIYNEPLVFGDMHRYAVTLNAERTRELLYDIPGKYHSQINDVLLTALCTTLCGFGNTSHILVGLESHGRELGAGDIDLSRTVGWFTNTCPVLLQQEGDTPGECLKNIKEQLRKVPGKGMGYMVLKYLLKLPALQGDDPVDVVFNYLGQADNAAGAGGRLSLAAEPVGQTVSDANPVSSRLTINSIVEAGVLTVRWTYSSRHYNEATIQALAKAYVTTLETLIEYGMLQEKAVFTPSDYGLGDVVSTEELDAFLDGSETDDIMIF